MISKVSRANYCRLGSVYLKFLETCEEWLAISNSFEEIRSNSNFLRAIDGEHVAIHPPANCSPFYYNYKHLHSVILLLVAGADYECIYVDIGTNGRVSDGGL